MGVLVVGSLNVDLTVTVERLPNRGETVLGSSLQRDAGGKGLNQAVAAARQGAAVSMVGCLGDDEAGSWLRSTLAAEGVGGECVSIAPGQASGTALITVDKSGDCQITVATGANGALTAQEVDDAFAQLQPGDGDVVLVQLEIPRDAVERALLLGRRAGCTTILNPAPAPATPLDPAVLALVDLLVPNEQELAQLGGDAQSLRAAGCDEVVVTRADRGADWYTGDSPPQRIDPFAVDAVDSTAAGDAFCGALAAALAAGASHRDALAHASAAGALAVTRHGAVGSLPTAAETAALLVL